jgi:hypothetical protein
MLTGSPVPPGRLACGAVLHVQALTQALSEPWEYDAGPPDMIRIAQKADEIGFLYIGVCDHCVVPDVSEGFGRANPGAAGNMRTTWFDTTPRADMPRAIATIRKHAEQAGRSTPIAIGFMAEWIYVGKPSWDLGPAPHLTGHPEAVADSLREIGAMGCSHIQVRLRSRSLDELLDQMDIFAAGVSPLLVA